MNQEPSKTHTDSAHLLRAIERGIVYDRLPAPTGIDLHPQYGSAKLRFATAEDVREWQGLTGATVVTGQHVYDRDTEGPWHEVGTEQGGKPGELVGWQVTLWASVDGLPEQEQDWYFTFGSGQQFDGMYTVVAGTYDTSRDEMFRVFGSRWAYQYASVEKAGVYRFGMALLPRAEWPSPVVEQEHRHVGGSGGAPGECSAECACGVTFDGFDTIAEASELLERHIADATAADAPAGE